MGPCAMGVHLIDQTATLSVQNAGRRQIFGFKSVRQVFFFCFNQSAPAHRKETAIQTKFRLRLRPRGHTMNSCSLPVSDHVISRDHDVARALDSNPGRAVDSGLVYTPI
ncbi:hypothetical protein EVAR_47326_1 [Eumeta japonica]|uniref:Uncharacterized protein n=1 Tax=Eumeta variegata TaxID=151549 RepID=A0A4C1YKX3_EUMVA|nr:hypothetical protein EVAR_47326_1 [Eumeta japonica]